MRDFDTEQTEQGRGLVIQHRPLWEISGVEADQVRLALRLRAARGGNVVPFDRTAHAQAAVLVEVQG